MHSFEEEGATIPQALLPLIPEDATRISDLISVVRQDGQWFYYCGTQPVFQHAEADLRSFRMFTAQLCVQRACKQAEIIKAFGVSKSSVLRSVNKYREEGIAGFYQPRRARGAPVMTPEVIQQAQQRFEEGHSKTVSLGSDPVLSFIEYCQDLFDVLPGRRGLGDRLVRSSSQVAHTVWMRQPKERRQFAQRGGRAAVS